MWVGKMGFMVWTKDAVHAGTDHLVTVEVMRDNRVLWAGRFDFPTEDDLEPGAQRFYGYEINGLFLDDTPPLPAGIGRIPSPYPSRGMEYSHGLSGHLRSRLRIHGHDMWTKDKVEIYVKEIRQLATSFDTLEWIEDSDWTKLGTWGADADLSTDSSEGSTTWTLGF